MTRRGFFPVSSPKIFVPTLHHLLQNLFSPWVSIILNKNRSKRYQEATMPTFDQKRKRKAPSAKRRLNFDDDHEEEKQNGANLSAEIVDDEVIVLNESPLIIPATPQKKRRRRIDEKDGNRDRKQGIASYFSPAKTTAVGDSRKASVLVTPEKVGDEEQEKEKEYVPTYIHKNLNYKRRGMASLDENLERTFDLVEEHYVIPSDFENNRSYGPLSGTCFEQRAVDAYEKGLLVPIRSSKEGDVLICVYCAQLGHRQDDCPQLI